MPGAVFGLAATSLRGCTASASEPGESQLIALMTRTRILDGCVGCWAASEPYSIV
jgi:hypothetical protein